MTIDIITLTAKQYAALSAEQLDKVRAAQLKKEGYKAALEEEKRKKKYALVRAGIFRSCVYEKLCAALTAEYEEKTAAVRQGLLFYLQYAAKPETSGGTSAEYADYSLSATERVQAVKNYYHAKYTNASERFDAFKKDTTGADISRRVLFGDVRLFCAGKLNCFKNRGERRGKRLTFFSLLF